MLAVQTCTVVMSHSAYTCRPMGEHIFQGGGGAIIAEKLVWEGGGGGDKFGGGPNFKVTGPVWGLPR